MPSPPQLDVIGAFYYEIQNNYNSSTTPCAAVPTTFVQPNGSTSTVIRVNNTACSGTQDAISFMVDYRPLKRVDLYAGVMISNVYAGLANGYPAGPKHRPDGRLAHQVLTAAIHRLEWPASALLKIGAASGGFGGG